MTKLARLTGVNGPFYIMAEKVLAIYKDENDKTMIDTGDINYLVKEDPDTAAAIIEGAFKPVFVFGDINSDKGE